MIEKRQSESTVVMEQLVMPNDTNMLNNLFGGRLLEWIDIAGALCATKHARCKVVTVSIDSVAFKHPVNVGDMVKIEANVIDTGRTSIKVQVTVYREKPLTGDILKTNQATMTFVALDEQCKPTEVPKIIKQSR
jgi:acyl-CoA hydrolase